MRPGFASRLAAVAALATLSASATRAEPPQPAGSDPLLACIAAQGQALGFSGVVSVVGPSTTTLYAHGVEGGPGSREIGRDTRFNLASAGKMFTAVSVAQLVDAGKLGLDDPIGRYVEGLTPQASAVTVRQLLTHTSGLGNFFTLENLPAIEKARTVSDLMALVGADKPEFPPGSRVQYSNTGFLLLGRLVERVSGLSYDDYLRRHVFAPAGMTSTGLEPGPISVQAVGLTRMPVMGPPPPTGAPGGLIRLMPGPGPNGPTGPLRPAAEAALRGSPAGGSYSTAGDMQRFFAALINARLTSPAMLKALTSAQVVAAPAASEPSPVGHALGFGVGVYNGHRWFGHNGGAPGVNVEATAYPDDRDTVIVMANRDPPLASAMFQRVRAMLLDPATSGACPQRP